MNGSNVRDSGPQQSPSASLNASSHFRANSGQVITGSGAKADLTLPAGRAIFG
jgi:hypothetical protein